jgi:Na+/H+-dicarboxylate symporter
MCITVFIYILELSAGLKIERLCPFIDFIVSIVVPLLEFGFMVLTSVLVGLWSLYRIMHDHRWKLLCMWRFKFLS